jgi:hypothetical protein
MSIDYFVSYAARSPGDLSAKIGRCSIAAQEPITGIDRVEAMEAALIKKNGYEWCAITGWQRFEATEADEAEKEKTE